MAIWPFSPLSNNPYNWTNLRTIPIKLTPSSYEYDLQQRAHGTTNFGPNNISMVIAYNALPSGGDKGNERGNNHFLQKDFLQQLLHCHKLSPPPQRKLISSYQNFNCLKLIMKIYKLLKFYFQYVISSYFRFRCLKKKKQLFLKKKNYKHV